MRAKVLVLIFVLPIIIGSGFLYQEIQELDSCYDTDSWANWTQDTDNCPTKLAYHNRELVLRNFSIIRGTLDTSLYAERRNMYFSIQIIFTDNLEYDINVKPVGFKIVSSLLAVWEDNFVQTYRSDCGLNCLEKDARGGSRHWEEGIEVVPLIIFEFDGNQHILRGPSAKLGVTWA